MEILVCLYSRIPVFLVLLLDTLERDRNCCFCFGGGFGIFWGDLELRKEYLLLGEEIAGLLFIKIYF